MKSAAFRVAKGQGWTLATGCWRLTASAIASVPRITPGTTLGERAGERADRPADDRRGDGLSGRRDHDRLVEIDDLVVEQHAHPIDLSAGDIDRLPRALRDDLAPPRALVGVDRKPVEAVVGHVVLLPHHTLRKRIAAELHHPRDRDRVIAVHPMSLVGVDRHEVGIAIRILREARRPADRTSRSTRCRTRIVHSFHAPGRFAMRGTTMANSDQSWPKSIHGS